MCVIKRSLIFKNYIDCLLKIRSYYNHNKDLKVIIIMYTLNKLIKSRKDFKHFMKLQRIHMEQTHSKYAKVRC